MFIISEPHDHTTASTAQVGSTPLATSSMPVLIPLCVDPRIADLVVGGEGGGAGCTVDCDCEQGSCLAVVSLYVAPARMQG